MIKVSVRIRPLVKEERDVKDVIAWHWDRNTLTLPEHGGGTTVPKGKAFEQYHAKQQFRFDHLFEPQSTNGEVFTTVVSRVVEDVMNGFHGSVFSYGQTSSGKTFTMTGSSSQPGIIPMAIQQCFDAVHSFPEREFLLRVSYLEVYNEQINDLLNMEPTPIKLQHDKKLGTVLNGVKEMVVFDPQQVLALLKAGEAHRHVGSTDMNQKSSRAHTLFRLIVESNDRSSKGSLTKVSTMNLVDLAGSESAKMTNSRGERAREAKFINQSLLTLSTIIQRLSEEKHGANGSGPTRKQHLPYRDSKLTRILESALGGNARISIICTVSPASRCIEETVNTLKFATRAKLIRMNAKMNETADDKTLLRVYREEIEQLRKRLKELEEQNKGNVKAIRPESPGARSEDEGELEENMMLQMIAEMERMILKADASKTSTKRKGAVGKITRLFRPRSNQEFNIMERHNSSKLLPGGLGSVSMDARISEGSNASSSGETPPGNVKFQANPLRKAISRGLNYVLKGSHRRESLNESLNSAGKTPNNSPQKQPHGRDGLKKEENGPEADPHEASPIEGGSLNERLGFTGNNALAMSTRASLNGRHSNGTTDDSALKSADQMSRIPEPSNYKGRSLSENSSAAAASVLRSALLEERDVVGRLSIGGLDLDSMSGSRSRSGSMALDRQLQPVEEEDPVVSAPISPTMASDPPSPGRGIHRLNSALMMLEQVASGDDHDVILSEEEEDLEEESADLSAGAEEDSVLLGVSKMLMLLKSTVAKARSNRNRNAVLQRKMSEGSIALPSSDSEKAVEELIKKSASVEGVDPQGLIAKEQFDRLKLDLRLKEADNRFLQEELDNKDRMLSMLTEGLKEVEVSQTQWLTANQELTIELERVMGENQYLRTQLESLQEQLQRQSDSII